MGEANWSTSHPYAKCFVPATKKAGTTAQALENQSISTSLGARRGSSLKASGWVFEVEF